MSALITSGRIYRGRRTGHIARALCPDGSPLPLRLDVAWHSPTGVEWGYAGSGPAQLALALLLHGDPWANDPMTPRAGRLSELQLRALESYQRFKARLIQYLPREWDLDAAALFSFVALLALEASGEGDRIDWQEWRDGLRRFGLLVSVKREESCL